MLPLPPHADPDIGVHHVGLLDRHLGILADLDRPAGMLRLHTRQIHDPLVRLVAARASEADGHAHFGRSFDQRVGHVVAVSDVGQLYAVQGALLLPDGEQIGERLARMAHIRQSVDDWNRRLSRPLFDRGVVIGSDHEPVQIAREHAGRVRDTFAATELNVGGRQEQRLPAELSDAGLEGDPGPRGRLLEQQAQRRAGQVLMGPATLPHRFQLARQPQEPHDPARRDRPDRQQIFPASTSERRRLTRCSESPSGHGASMLC